MDFQPCQDQPKFGIWDFTFQDLAIKIDNNFIVTVNAMNVRLMMTFALFGLHPNNHSVEH